MKKPTISAVVTVYNAEEYVAETLTSILSQTLPPDEVIVVDDGSTDGTPSELQKFRSDIRIVRQTNGGHASALNHGFRIARGDYLAKCDADDIWRQDKLQRQVDALLAHPEIDIAFSAVWVFGLIEGPYGLPPDYREYGILRPEKFAGALFRENVVCPSSTLIRRELYERLGPFVENLPAEDYDYWMRSLAAGAVFYYDPEYLVRYRRHDRQITSNRLAVRRAAYTVRLWHEDRFHDRRLVRSVLSSDLYEIGRMLVDVGDRDAARAAFRVSLRRWPRPAALAWIALLSLPWPYRSRLIDASVTLKRGLSRILAAQAG